MTGTFWQGINKRFISSHLHSNKSLSKQFVQKLLGIFGRNHCQFTNLEINQYFYYTMATVFKVSGWCNNKINYHGNIFGFIKIPDSDWCQPWVSHIMPPAMLLLLTCFCSMCFLSKSNLKILKHLEPNLSRNSKN